MIEYQGPFWLINLPDNWQGHHSLDVDNLFSQDGVGAVEINSMMNEIPVKDSDLRIYASEHLDKGHISESVSLGDFSGLALEFESEDTFHMKSFVKAGSIILFISYSCKVNEKHLEVDQIKAFLKTLSVNCGM